MNVIKLYHSRGFKIKIINSDNEFAYIKDSISDWDILLNVSSRSEHVPVIERRIRVIKERVRSIRHSLPFKILPKIMIIEMVKYCIKWLNVFPSKGGINNMSPRTVMVGRNID